MTKEKILELGQRYVALQKEIEANLRILRDYEDAIGQYLRNVKTTELSSTKFGVKISKKIKTTKKFNSALLKKENIAIYNDCKKPANPRFDKKLVEQKYPQIYDQYFEVDEITSINIEPYEDDELDLEEIGF